MFCSFILCVYLSELAKQENAFIAQWSSFIEGMRGIRSFVHVEVQLEVNFQNK